MRIKTFLMMAVLAIVSMIGVLVLEGCGSSTSAPASSSPSASPRPSSPATSASPSSPVASAAPTVDPEWSKVVEAAKKQGKLTMYGQWAATAQEVLRKTFNAQYPEITLDFITGSGSQVMERIQTEQRSAKYVADVFRAGSTSSRAMKKNELLTPFEPPITKDSSIKWRDERLLREDQTHSYTVFSAVTFAPIVNTGLLKAGQEPKSYKELTDPKWKGQLMIFSPKLSGEGSKWYAFIGKGLFGPKPYAGPDYLEKMKGQEIRWITNYDDGANFVARGEAPVMFPTTASAAIRLREAGAPTKFLTQMSEGLFVSQIGWGVVKNAPHPEAAKLFINWLGSVEGQKALEAIGDSPLRDGIPVTAPENAIPQGIDMLSLTSDQDEEKMSVARKEAEEFFGIK